MKERLGFGIIGCGVISRWHADAIALAEDAYLVGATDNRIESAVKFADEYKCKAFADADEMLASNEIDIVCICTPSGLHAEYAIKVANAGKHFVVEKPMAITKEQIDGIISACEKNSVKGCVISQFRFAPAVQAVKKAIDDGLLGKILVTELSMKYYRSPEYYKTADWRGTWEMDGGGALMNQGIHGIDVMQYLSGQVRSVYGICKTLYHDIEVEDTASLTVEYENEAVGTISATTSVEPGYPRVLQISGTKGSVTLTEDRITHWDIKDVAMPEVCANKTNTSSHSDPLSIPIENHAKQIKDMIEAVKYDRKPSIDIYDGKKAVDIILAAYESSKSGRTITI